MSESEWEYAARAGTVTSRYWGEAIGRNNANCNGCGSQQSQVSGDPEGKETTPVGSFVPNGFGLYDMLGNVWQWVEDCWQDNYKNVPADGTANTFEKCEYRVIRGGSWNSDPKYLRAAGRYNDSPDDRTRILGFRVARTLSN